MQIQTLNYVDVTILLYLPADTKLDDLCFLANWAEKVVELAEEKMILKGKDIRYIRHRVLPIIHGKADKDSETEEEWNPETWKNLTKFKVAESVPEWVKIMSDSESDSELSDMSVISEEFSEEQAVCTFAQTVSDAAKFSFPNVIKTNKATGDISDCDSFYSEESATKKIVLTRSSSFSSSSDFRGKNGGGKHIILAIADEYDRDQLKNVRRVVTKEKVSFLPIGLGNRGMIGLGGYYARSLGEISSIQDQIINRLTFMV